MARGDSGGLVMSPAERAHSQIACSQGGPASHEWRLGNVHIRRYHEPKKPFYFVTIFSKEPWEYKNRDHKCL